MLLLLPFSIAVLSLVEYASAFTQRNVRVLTATTTGPAIGESTTTSALFSSIPSDVSSTSSLTLADLKADLVRACTTTSSGPEDKAKLDQIKMLVRDLEDKAEMVGEGQGSSISGLLAGEWYVQNVP